jgi:hypothetical protein
MLQIPQPSGLSQAPIAVGVGVPELRPLLERARSVLFSVLTRSREERGDEDGTYTGCGENGINKKR